MADKYVSAHDQQSPLYQASPARDPHLSVFETSSRLLMILQGMVTSIPMLAGFRGAIGALVNDMSTLRADLYPEDAIAVQKAKDDAEIEALAAAKVKAAQGAGTQEEIVARLDQHSELTAMTAAATAESAEAQAAASKEAVDKAKALDEAATVRAREILMASAPPQFANPLAGPATAAEIAAGPARRQPARVAS